MPIYEFYCRKCNTIYSFFSRSVNTETIPFCPRCKKIRLKRQMSLFAKIIPGRSESEGDLPPFDEAKAGQAMEMLAREMGSFNENDPRQTAQLMRKFSEISGLSLGSKMEEALSRLESGEDPEAIENELGDSISDDDLFVMAKKVAAGKKDKKPRIDETLYDL
jgi:putative FmdB family regulatory protein